jgi:hypothetical protein
MLDCLDAIGTYARLRDPIRTTLVHALHLIMISLLAVNAHAPLCHLQMRDVFEKSDGTKLGYRAAPSSRDSER